MEQIIELFRKLTGTDPESVTALPASGSNRKYFRVSGAGRNVIATEGNCPEENRAFCALADHFFKAGLNVPQVYASNQDCSVYLQEDLGAVSLFDAVAKGRTEGVYSDQEKELLKAAVRELPRIQFRGAEGLDFSVCYPVSAFDRRSVGFDLNYFKYCFLKPYLGDFNEILLEKDFDKLTDDLTGVESESFLYRDFQSRNVMIKDGVPYFIDFQGGRRGPFYYDLASFVWQARSAYPAGLKHELVEVYREALRPFRDVHEDVFYRNLRKFVLFRTLQVLGAYGFRGLYEGKPHFIQSIPYALDNVRELLSEPFDEYPYLSKLLLEVVSLKKLKTNIVEHDRLCVKIFSFAYRNGIPADDSGNGGGYVFDCRGLHNPGRYDQYKSLTGLDKPVADFLSNEAEVADFLDDVYALAERHVRRYVERGFNSLMFSFGCTGGQHRSVYCAERLAEYVHRCFPDVEVHVCHRERGLSRTLGR